MRIFYSPDDAAGGGSATPVDTSPAPESPVATPSDAAPAADAAPQYGFDSPDAFVATPWLSELDEERRTYLVDGFKSLYDKRTEIEAAKTAAEEEWREKHEAAARDAATYMRFLEDANPDFKELREAKAALEARAQKADETAAELERVRAEYAAGEATRAELKAATATHEAALHKLNVEKANAIAEAEDAKRQAEQHKALAEAQGDEFSDSLYDATMAMLALHDPNASEAHLEAAAAAYLTTLAAEAEKLEPGAVKAQRRQIISAAMKSALAALPKPDFVPASVRGMNHNGAGVSSSANADMKAAYNAAVSKGADPFVVAEQVARTFNVSPLKVLEALKPGR